MAMITWGEGILKSIVTAERSDPSRRTYWNWVGTLSAEDGMEWQLRKLELDEIANALPPHERTKEQQELLEDHGLRAGQRWWKERQANAERLRELQEKSAKAAAQGYKLVSIEEEEKRALESQLKPQSTRPWPLINGVRIDDLTGYIPVPESKQESLGALVEEVEALLGLDTPLPEGVSSDPPQETGQQLPNGSSSRVEFPEFETKFVPNPFLAARLASAQRSKEKEKEKEKGKEVKERSPEVDVPPGLPTNYEASSELYLQRMERQNEKHHQRAREAIPATPASPTPSRLDNSNSRKTPSQSDLPSPPPQGPLVTTFPRLASDEKIWQELHPHSTSCKYVTAVNREKSETSRAVITSCPCRGHEHLACVEFDQDVDGADVLRHVVWLRPEELIESQARKMKQKKVVEEEEEEEMPELVPARSEQPEQKQQSVHAPPPAPTAPEDAALSGLAVPPGVPQFTPIRRYVMGRKIRPRVPAPPGSYLSHPSQHLMYLGDGASRLHSGGAMRFNSRYPLKPRELYTREQQAQRYGSSEKAMVYDAWLDQMPRFDPYGYRCTSPGPVPSPMPLPELWHMSGANYELSSSVGGVASSAEKTTMGATSTSPPRVATPTAPPPPSPPKPQPQLPQASSDNSERASFPPSCAESSKRRPVMCIGDAFINLMMDTTSPSSPSGVAPLSVSSVVQVADECEVDDDNDDSDWDLAGGSEVSEEETDTDDNNDKTLNLLDLLDGDDDSGLEDWVMV
ncbi:hypothetical protein PG987_010295 [Apiospora arundinis]